ncbi:MAG: hypothetical protein A2W99_16070 [Bacteroidetes bacterium GWF2_33_16]|nr:MAG: hypothetical protein A2X00_15415 [Bacteroidetes bacterium GWE2_32_14]OFY02418.1 MAG: hypothetical protein A2W99_16070 [Bacteroidetes bacterium GWF2_33_16]
MKNLLVIFIGFILISACNSPTSKMESDSNLESKLKGTVLSDTNSIIMKELTEFDWDSLLILTPYAIPEALEKSYNVNLKPIYEVGIDYRDDICLLIFFKNREIINYVEYPRYPGDFSGATIRMVGKEDAVYEIVITEEKSTDGNDWIRLKHK